MIQADLHGKTGVPEDVLTSCCLGLLQLLPDNFFIDLMQHAQFRDRQRLYLTGFDRIRGLSYWPWLNNGGIPDVIATLESSSLLRQLKIVIEVKHGAGKSSGDEDQLARYYKAAVKRFKNCEVVLLYLTHHRAMPAHELDESLTLLAGEGRICWLSWHTVTRWANEKVRQVQFPIAEHRILSLLKQYLDTKGYGCFEKLNNVSIGVKPEALYTRRYLSIPIGSIPYPNKLYQHLYTVRLSRPGIQTIYKP